MIDTDDDGMGSSAFVRRLQRADVEAEIVPAGGLAAAVLASDVVVVDVDHSMPLMREETFGPVAPIMRVKDIDEAIALANDSEYGLGANILTNKLEYAMKAAERVKAGTFWINDPLTDNDAGPFGGMRMSGGGRELGMEGLEEFRETKHVHLDYQLELKPYWYPYDWSKGRKTE